MAINKKKSGRPPFVTSELFREGICIITSSAGAYLAIICADHVWQQEESTVLLARQNIKDLVHGIAQRFVLNVVTGESILVSHMTSLNANSSHILAQRDITYACVM